MTGIGLNREEKGFSTDVALRIEVQDNLTAQVARLSLKKDGDIFLFNGSTGDIIKIATRLGQLGKISSKSKTQGYIDEIKDFPISQQKSAEALAKTMQERTLESKDHDALTPEVIKRRWKIWRDRTNNTRLFGDEYVTRAINARIAIASAITSSPKDIRQALYDAGVIESLQSDEQFRGAVTDAAKVERTLLDGLEFPELDKYLQLSVSAGNAALKSLVGNSEMRREFLNELQKKFPIGQIMQGGEMMCLGGVPISRETLISIFGTDNYDEINTRLTIIRDKKTGKLILLYKGKTRSKAVNIATIEARQKKQGVTGNIAVEFRVTPAFECAAAYANAKPENSPRNTNSNKEMLTKCRSDKDRYTGLSDRPRRQKKAPKGQNDTPKARS
jgi:hypothetical protein